VASAPDGAPPSDTPELLDVVGLADVETIARARMSAMAYEFVAAGAADEITVRWNREAFDRLRLCPRVLRDAGAVDTGTRLFGRELAHPILLAPTAYHRVVHPDGELATARGAGAAGAVWVVSTNTNTPIEQIAACSSSPLWFQLYVQSDRGFTRELVERVVESGCEVLCLTVDTPAIGVRDRQRKAGFRLPPGIETPHIFDVVSGKRDIMTPGRESVTWKDVEWLGSIAGVPLVLKGIVNPADARQAVSAGVDGVIVSNHGGRNLDTLPATADALPRVVEAVADRIPVLVDGGIRRGTDVVKAIGLGAAAVLIGRPYLFGLGAAGAPGVRQVVEILRAELELALALCGCPSLASVDADVIWPG